MDKIVGQPFEFGYNAMHNRVENLMESGVLDPAKVTRNGLRNAAGIAGIMLTTQAVMVESRPEPTEGGARRTAKPDLGFNQNGMPAGLTM